ncbi:Imm1 family immunity protein [Aquisphaera insulae]|uniref:Imm1 family immunity protein n=1 Tax=Aquisphaera insulae TaxID=2712864 RepID=UPI0013EC6F78|nr:Imm1 family immunity protein [Aquisphaera insulae]
MCTFIATNARGTVKLPVDTPVRMPRLIRELERAGFDGALLELHRHVYLVVVINRRGMAIIFHDDSKDPRLLDASTSPEVSRERVNITYGGQHTQLPRNMRLPRKVAIEVLRHFCETRGGLSPQVFWLPEMAPNP